MPARANETKVCIAADKGIVSEINLILFPNNAVILYKTFIIFSIVFQKL